MSDPRRHLSRSPASGTTSALLKVRDASEPLRVLTWAADISGQAACQMFPNVWMAASRGAGARAQTAAISAQASTSRRLRQRPLPPSDATDRCLRLPSCRSLPARWQLELDHAPWGPRRANVLSAKSSSLRSGSSVACISKVFWHRFASFHRCSFRHHVKERHCGPAVLHHLPGPGPSSVRRTRHPHPPLEPRLLANLRRRSPGLTLTIRREPVRRMSDQGKSSVSASAAAPAPGSDTYKGWLFKWTNYLKGYQRRWFVLSNGLLSYYR